MGGQIFEIVQWAVGVIFGGGIVGTFMFFNSKKRVEKANADRAENEVESIRIRNKSDNYDAQDKIITDLKIEFEKLQSQFLELSKDNIKMKIRIAELELIAESNKNKINQLTNERCIVENCPKRNPPRKPINKCVDCNEKAD